MKLQEKYQKEVIPAMMKKFNYSNVMAVPKIKKVVVNVGFGRLVSGKNLSEQKKIYDAILEDMSMICGQRPVLTLAKKSIATFKIRQGMVIGAAVTLRKNKMNDFLERFINITLPRSRDFKGIDPKSFDKQGNLTIGIKEQIIFPEISPENIKNFFGLEIVISVSSKNKEEGIALLKLLGFPIKS